MPASLLLLSHIDFRKFIFHSLISQYINIGLITPNEIIEKVDKLLVEEQDKRKEKNGGVFDDFGMDMDF